MRLGPEDLFLIDRKAGLTVAAFQELLERWEPFALKINYRGLPPPLQALDLVHLRPARHSELSQGCLILCCDAEGFEFRRVSARDPLSSHGDDRVALVVQIERADTLIRLDSWRWRLLGALLVGVPEFPRAFERWRRIASFLGKLASPFPCPVSLGPPERLMEEVIAKYADPAEVQERVKLLAGGLEDGEEDFFARVLPGQGRLLIVGCAAGREAVALAKRGLTVMGIDPVPALVEAAQRHAEAHGVKAIFEAKTIDTLAVPPESFDVILCSCYLHIPTRHRRIEMLQTFARLLVPNGLLILAAGWYRDGSPRLTLVDGLRWLLRQLLGERFPTDPGDRLVRHMSLASDARVPYFCHVFQSAQEIDREIEAAGFVRAMASEGFCVIRRPA